MNSWNNQVGSGKGENKMIKQEIRKPKVQKRHQSIRVKLSGTTEFPRLAVYRSTKHIYAQLIDDVNHKTLASSSSNDKDLKEQLFNCLCDANSKALGVKNVEIEKRVKSTIPFFNYRQPDVLIEYQGRKIVFEIQL